MAQIIAEISTGLMVTLSNGRHEWNADEPLDVGGSDQGPNPYELLLGSLAACTCVTIAMYCRHKGLALESVRASYDFDRIHAKDCEDCDIREKGFIERIVSNVKISGDFDEKQRARIAQIAQRCPVHKTLTNGVEIEDQASFG